MKKILITGGASRLGKILTLNFLAKGHEIIIQYYGSVESAHDLQKSYPQLKIIKCDFTHPLELENFFNDINDLDILINNAGIFSNDDVKNFSYEKFKRVMDINLYAPITLTNKFINKYKKGIIINLLDSWAHDLPHNFLSYTLSKEALRNFTDIMNKQYNPDIEVFGISLGFTLYKEGFPKEFFDRMQKKYPSSPELLVKAVDFIISEGIISEKIIDLCKWN